MKRSVESLTIDIQKVFVRAAAAYDEEPVLSEIQAAKEALAVLADRAEDTPEFGPAHRNLDEIEDDLVNIGKPFARY